MLTLLIPAVAFLAWFFLTPFVVYFYDPNNLRKYPGRNLFSGVTSLAYIWDRRHTFPTRELYRKHMKHPVLRTGPTSLSYSDVRAINDIYGHGTPALKDDIYKFFTPGNPHILNVIDKEDHARKRRMLSNAFAVRNLEQWEFKITDKVQKMVAQFDKHCTSPISENSRSVNPQDLTVNFRRWSNLFTVDAIADIALSEPLGMLQAGSDNIAIGTKGGATKRFDFIESMHTGSKMITRYIGAIAWVPFLTALGSMLSPQFRAHSGDFGQIVSSLAEKRIKRQENETLADFIGRLIEDRAGKARNLERGEVEAETNILLDAGSDTTAIALTNVLYYLLKSPHCLARLREEVCEALSGDEIAPYAKVKSLPYLKACLDESLRLSPPVSRGPERKTPPQGMKILGEHIAGNISVSVPTYAAHRDPHLFPDPERFIPERWLDETDNDKKGMRAAFVPFTSGARACIGRNITMMEQQILMATLVQRYGFALASSDWKLSWREAFNIWPSPMPLKIWRRDNLENPSLQSMTAG